MIILLDIEKKEICLYKEDGLLKIPFSQAYDLCNYIDKNVYYITNAIEINAQDVINLIKNMGIVVEDSLANSPNTYLHAIDENPIYINENLQFKGKFDFKLLDDDMKEILDKNSLINQLIKIKKIEIINEVKKVKLMKELKEVQLKQLRKQEDIDKQLDRMILKTRVDDFAAGENSNEEEHEAEEIDILGSGSAIEEASINTMSQLLNYMDK